MGRESGRLDPGDLLDALEKSARQSEWSPLFTDDFQRTSVGDDWKIVRGQARIANGWMRLESAAAGDVYAVVRRPFPDNVRVEFDARFPQGLSYCGDLGCFVAGDEENCDRVGYCLSFAADGNTCSRLQRVGVDIRIDPKAVAEPGRTYHIAAEMVDGHMVLYVDGQELLSYLDLIPLAGVGHDRVGLVTFRYGGEFTNVRVLTHSGPSRTGTFTVADAYCRDALYDKAVDKYRQIAAAHPNQPIGLLAQCKVALAMMADERWSEAEAQLRGLADPCKGTDLEHLMALWHGRALGMMGKSDEALRIFKRVQEATSDPGIIDETAVACGLLSEALRRDERWLESGRFAKFLFEHLKTPLIETSHMFGLYGNRLHEAALFEEEYQAISKVGVAIAAKSTDPSHYVGAQFRRVRTAVLTGREDVAGSVLEELEAQARSAGDASLELSVIGHRIEIELSRGDYQAALERVTAYAGTEEEERGLKETAWGNTFADLRACACIMLGRIAEALDDLDAGRISRGCMDLRMSLAAELWRRGNQSAAINCLSVLQQSAPPRTGKLLRMASAALRGDALVEPLQEFVETSLQPVHQPRGFFLTGLALWASGNDGAATLPWSEAMNSALEVTPVWHWVNYFQGRVET